MAGYAERRRFAAIRYDDSDRSWCREFPWAVLRSRLATVRDEHGIAFEVVVSGAVGQQTSRRLAEEVDGNS